MAYDIEKILDKCEINVAYQQEMISNKVHHELKDNQGYKLSKLL